MRNPVIFLFLDECIRDKILRQTERFFPTGSVFNMPSADESREIIAKIQANEGGLRLNRVNIYVVVEAENPDALRLVENAGQRLSVQFRENFAAVDITLIISLNESNGCENIKERNTSTYKFLTGLATTLFNRIFLISNKNEYGEVFSESKNNAHALIAALPLLNLTQSYFNEALDAKMASQKQILFASAGFWQKTPSQLNENRVLHKLAEVLEEEMESDKGMVLLSREVQRDKRIAPLSPNIINNIAGVAAKPLRLWELWGLTVKEAESLLFGDEAVKFFERVYMRKIENFSECEIEATKKPLYQAVSEEAELREIISETENKLHELRGSMGQIEVTICRPKFFGSIDYVKNRIGEVYTLRYEYESLLVALDRQKSKQAQLESYLDYIRGVVQTLKSLPLTEPPPKTLNETEPYAPIQISLLRSDDLIRESHTFNTMNGEPCLLRLIGGFTLQDFRIQ
ncbi:MAG: hypothetical protein FWE27_10145 [Defluviitaleaceae bacterium]|nr:hypothetical protein [Defluviitaleaceae bacterium]